MRRGGEHPDAAAAPEPESPSAGFGVSILLPLKLISLANARMHWAEKARYVRSIRRAAMAVPKFRLPAVVTLTRIGPRPLDAHDGLPMSCKPLVDGISDRVGIADNHALIAWRYRQERGDYAVRIDIEEI